MSPSALRAFCLKLQPTYDLKWGQDHVYSVGGKMFAVVFDAKKGEESVSFKVDDGRFLELTDRPGLVPAPYLARAKWVQLTRLKALGDAELKSLVGMPWYPRSRPAPNAREARARRGPRENDQLPRFASQIPASTTAPPTNCAGPMASPNSAHAKRAAITGWMSRLTDESEAGRWANA